MPNVWEDRQLALIQAEYPDWQIWYVRPAYGPCIWCARPMETKREPYRVGSPDEIREAIYKTPTWSGAYLSKQNGASPVPPLTGEAP